MRAHVSTSVELLARWRRQIGAQRRSLRGLGGLACLVDGGPEADLVPLERLTLLVLHDLPRGDQVAVRLAAFAAGRVPHGVQWGGAAQRRLRKDLALAPAPRGQGLRLDLFDAPLVDAALRLNWRIDLALRYQRSAARARLRLPRLWAGFAEEVAADMTGDGPELAALAAKFGLPPAALLTKFRREHGGRTLFPLDWVSHRAPEAVGLWAELRGFPQRQVFGLGRETDQLVGYAGAAAFDFSDGQLMREASNRVCAAAAAG